MKQFRRVRKKDEFEVFLFFTKKSFSPNIFEFRFIFLPVFRFQFFVFRFGFSGLFFKVKKRASILLYVLLHVLLYVFISVL